jgi:hypothetical protein
MKYLAKHFFLGVMILALAGLVALGKEHDKVKKEHLTFATNVVVNGTALKAGDYDLRFNEQTGDLEILKGKKVVAKTTARLEQRTDGKAHETRITMNNDQLVSIVFSGEDHNIVVGQGSSGAEQ